MALLCPIGPQFFKNDGTVAAGCKLYTRVTGTTTPKTAWQNQAGSVAHAQPIDLDSAGYPDTASGLIWLTDGDEYRLHLETADGTLIWQEDDVYGIGEASNASLSDVASASKGAGQVYQALSLAYAAGSVGWWNRHAGVSLLRYIPSSKHAAIVAGSNTDDLQSYIQLALTDVLTYGFVLDGHGYTYKCDSGVTCQRSSANHAKRICIENMTLDFGDMGTSGSALTIGATSTSYFVEDGGITLRGVYLLGPESTTDDYKTDSPAGTTVGLDLQYAGGVTLASCGSNFFYKNAKTLYTFPLLGLKNNFRKGFIGLQLDETSNLQDWTQTNCQNCRYTVLIKSDSTSLDSGKSNNITFHKLWIEGSAVGPVIDSGSGGAGADRYKDIEFRQIYAANVTYDHFRAGTAFTFATPQTRGANCSEFINDLRIFFGLFNPAGGLYSATQALLAMDGVTRVRDLYIDAGVLDDATDADVIVGAPSGGMFRSRGYPGVSNGKIVETLWDSSGAIVRKMNADGSIEAANMVIRPAASVTPTANGDVTFQLTSNTSLTFKAKGSDGTVRSGSVTLS